ETAVTELALVERTELSDEDSRTFEETAVRVGAMRWASEPRMVHPGALTIRTEPGQPGETCVALFDHSQKAPLVRRCTYGLVWEASARSAAHGSSLALAVQPLAGWTELWIFHKTPSAAAHPGEGGEWMVDTLAPAVTDPELGYVEFAGFSPDGAHLL